MMSIYTVYPGFYADFRSEGFTKEKIIPNAFPEKSQVPRKTAFCGFNIFSVHFFFNILQNKIQQKLDILMPTLNDLESKKLLTEGTNAIFICKKTAKQRLK
jgi:hypothetical protein